MKRVAIIGMGSIGTAIVDRWQASPPPGHQLVGVQVRAGHRARVAGSLPAGMAIATDLPELIALDPDIVIEAAGQPVVVELGETVLRAGCDLMVISVGALADPALRARLVATALAGGGRILLPVGGIAGLDGLRAMVASGATRVRYTSIKPAHSWLGTPAESAFDLLGMTKRTVIFSGGAAEAALRYPRNANLAAAVALAGVGFEQTQIDLVADPHAEGLTGIIEAESEGGTMRVELMGRMSATNAKTSSVVGISALAALANSEAILSFV